MRHLDLAVPRKSELRNSQKITGVYRVWRSSCFATEDKKSIVETYNITWDPNHNVGLSHLTLKKFSYFQRRGYNQHYTSPVLKYRPTAEETITMALKSSPSMFTSTPFSYFPYYTCKNRIFVNL